MWGGTEEGEREVEETVERGTDGGGRCQPADSTGSLANSQEKVCKLG